MVDFRYHLVSIIAVFLALATGIVVGTTALNGPVLDGLKSSISDLTHDKRALEGNVNDLRGTVKGDDAFAGLVAPQMIDGRLRGQQVLVVSTPDASSDMRDNVVSDVHASGGGVAGEVRLRPNLLDPAKSKTVNDVVSKVVPADLALPKGNATERAGAELAAALVRTKATATIVSADAAQKVLAGFIAADLLDVESDAVEPTATLVVIVSGPTPVKSSSDVVARNTAVLTFVDAFDSRSGVVLVGPVGAADSGGLVGTLRSGGRAERVATVDDADRNQGRIATILALRDQAAGKSGKYGTGKGAQATAPKP